MSPDSRSTISLAKTLCFLAEGFEYETLEEINGNAAVIKFDFDNPHYTAGDVLVIMDGEEIVFHGMIGQIAEGYAVASDRRSSLLPATVQ
jgi:hypothetical protein